MKADEGEEHIRSVAMGDRRPTQGERTQLERISAIYWVLVGEQLTPGALITYRLIERGTGREIHSLTPTMVASLLQEGWIEPDGTGERTVNARRWGYCITIEGIRARDAGWR